MTQLFILLFIVGGTYGALTLLNTFVKGVKLVKALRGRISLSLFFIFAGVSHFIVTQEMTQMLPAFIPLRTEIIYLTGISEILGGIGLLSSRWARLSSILLILFLIGVLPANIYAAMASIEFGGHAFGASYLLIRVPFQLFLIAWAYYFGIKLSPQQTRVKGFKPSYTP